MDFRSHRVIDHRFKQSFGICVPVVSEEHV